MLTYSKIISPKMNKCRSQVFVCSSVKPKRQQSIKLPVKVVKMYGRFNIETENFHGRMAMISLIPCVALEKLKGIQIPDQIASVTHLPLSTVGGIIVFVTMGFILHSVNPKTEGAFQQDLRVFENPGFTLETEVLHGRIAMMVFSYAIIAELLTKHNAF